MLPHPKLEFASFTSGWSLRDPQRGSRVFKALLELLAHQRLECLRQPLASLLSHNPDPDMAWNNLERYLAAAPGMFDKLLEDDAAGLTALLPLLGTSQFFADILVANPDFLEMLRVPLRQSPTPEELREQLRAEVNAVGDDAALLRAFRRYRQQQMLRIGTNDIIRDRPLEEITLDLSHVADAGLQIALEVALRHISERFGWPFTHFEQPARCCCLAFGKLGGQELNYSSDIDLMFVYDEDGGTRGRGAGIPIDEFFTRVVGEVLRLLAARTEQGAGWRIDLRLRPEGHRGALVRSLGSTLSYYDTLGRTWERQALIKIRPAAGDLELGNEFLRNIEPFVYRRYLSFAEINEIKVMKRRIEQKAQAAGESRSEVKTGRGGIRDIEFTIQFLQLLNGGDLTAVRQRNTLLAMQALEAAGCLTLQEHQILDDGYRFLRRTEHRLQLLFDLQTHRVPDAPEELRKLALRTGYGERESAEFAPPRLPRTPLDKVSEKPLDTRHLLVDPLDSFLHDHHEKTRLNRQILNHLLHDAFVDADEQAQPETDLILEPEAEEATIQDVLGRYPFRDVQAAYRNLAQLAQESVPFLSTRRCRHFLASIAPALLRAISETPDPDLALLNLEKVTASLGAKAVLWELFSFSPPSLKLTVDLCAGSQFLTEILINSPGMIDDLLDSLVLNQPRTLTELKAELAELCRKATDTAPIVRSFQDKELLRIGVRDLLGKATIRETTAALSDLAETLLTQVTTLQLPAMEEALGMPALDRPSSAAWPCRFAILGLGKLGGREMSYHSDLDLILIYEGDGITVPPPECKFAEDFRRTDNLHYFTELAQRVIKAMSFAGPQGRLYAVDMRLRPTGRSGSLVISLPEFRRYYNEGLAQLWERQALTRARVVFGDAAFASEIMDAVRQAAFARDWKPEMVGEILSMRQRLELSRGPRDLKRGRGGSVDIEFLVQMLQLKHGCEHPELHWSNTWETLEALQSLGVLAKADYEGLRTSYDFLRQVESRLRLMTNRPLDVWPEAADEQEKLARRLGYEAKDGQTAAGQFRAELGQHTRQTRERFLRLISANATMGEAR
ncbi:MAG TPA: bifunctional [glutamate--ammonia ligase]-adenylyl-L-tyrosine phosphorylase/[glutamate--ammonia-ligase] adenylyltransferase [Gemmataceae bacterium]|nr:bifunctional [glutamate--ammonia ligase]-adenylyl-L-tyrosine phosphorylase/[glutamate--ammonia-ligase] adenylyltransferase [Gemmataceae bacterium]